MEIVLGYEKHIDEIEQLIGECIKEMNRTNILQWDEKYPNRQFFKDAMKRKQLYIMICNNEIIGVVIINESQNSGWEAIKWNLKCKNILVIHSLAIKVGYQGKGYGKTLLNYCENYARENGYHCIRLDTYSGNEYANRLYNNHGYKFVGDVKYTFKPSGHQLYHCYEKDLQN